MLPCWINPKNNGLLKRFDNLAKAFNTVYIQRVLTMLSAVEHRLEVLEYVREMNWHVAILVTRTL